MLRRNLPHVPYYYTNYYICVGILIDERLHRFVANSHLWQIHDLPLIFVIKLLPKPAADQEPTSPTNFHPIALTSCVGKIFIMGGLQRNDFLWQHASSAWCT